MGTRYVELLGMMFVASLWGWYEGSMLLLFSGCVLAAVAWMALDSWRFGQVLHWMSEGDWANEPILPHVWQLLVNKIRRLRKLFVTRLFLRREQEMLREKQEI